LEADFEHYYQRDLLDLWRGSLTPRKAAVLALHLPAGAMTWKAMGIDAAWTDEAHLLAFNGDVSQIANWQRGEGKGPKPKPIPRPGEKVRAEAKAATAADRARRFLARQQAQTKTPKEA
jgi:hypothetical protein